MRTKFITERFDLPTTEPSAPGLLWNDGGVVRVTVLTGQRSLDPETHILHLEEMLGLSSSFTLDHGTGQPVDVLFLDRDGCVVEVAIKHASDLNSTTVTTVAPMDGFLYFLH